MATFRFRLATLLRLREAGRDERRADLADALRADRVLEERVEQYDQDLAELLASAIETASAGPVNVDFLLSAQRYEILLRAERAETVRQRGLLATEIAKRQAALVEADREVRVLEKLRERHWERFRAEEERREQAQLDEFAVQGWLRQEAAP